MQASEGMVGNDNNNAGTGGANNAATPAANPSGGPNTSALPNPWAAPGCVIFLLSVHFAHQPASASGGSGGTNAFFCSAPFLCICL